MAGYDFASIEKKWQRYWDENNTFRQPNPGEENFADNPRYYILPFFPYPSGAGLHVGHAANYTPTDVLARYWRMRGRNVLYPTGFDAFGLPAEQYAVEQGVHPRETTRANIDNMIRQMKAAGYSYDWDRAFSTTDPDYYGWTQWIFLWLYNSWYDPQQDRARPIGDLIHDLESGELVVDLGGNVVPPPISESVEAVGGTPGGFYKFQELQPDQQRRLIDEYRLAYQAEVPVNWCPMLGTVLANEEVTAEGRSERGDHPVYRRAMRQWMLRITSYAERLLADLELVDWPDHIKAMQRNWIGRSAGAEVDFPLASAAGDEWFEARGESVFPAAPEDDVIRVYTTRPDTLFGATYMVLAPEHPLVERITTDRQREQVEQYVAQAVNKSELERTAESKIKTGVFTGAYAVNPVNREQIPIWVADYVMLSYGTGAIMAVPAHDTRDLEFAEQFDLPVIQVVQPPEGEDWRGFEGEGTAVNSGDYDGLPTPEFKRTITEDLERAGVGRGAVNYKLRDWLFSRQRYWGEPFPIVHCRECGTVDLSEDDLPLLLPEMDDFTPESSSDPTALPHPPLARAAEWVKTTCPNCSGPAERETNTMPQWAGSCWYYLRFCDPHNDRRPCSPKLEKYWLGPAGNNRSGGVDLYVGGAEHAVLHLLYARFWHKLLYDLGHVSTPEPFARLRNQGMVLSFAHRDKRGMPVPPELVDNSGETPVHRETGEELTETVEKMSKSLKNVINPDDVISKYGADTFRMYTLFMGPLESEKPWNPRDVPGVHRFCQRVWRMIAGDENGSAVVTDDPADDELERALHKLIRKVGDDLEAMKFNTAIAAMMEFANAVQKAGKIERSQAQRFMLLLAPFAPHLAEELWRKLGRRESLARHLWPEYDEDMLTEADVELPVQVNGKVRGRIRVAADADEDKVLSVAMEDAGVARAVGEKNVVKTIVVPGRLVNLVAK